MNFSKRNTRPNRIDTGLHITFIDCTGKCICAAPIDSSYWLSYSVFSGISGHLREMYNFEQIQRVQLPLYGRGQMRIVETLIECSNYILLLNEYVSVGGQKGGREKEANTERNAE